MVYVTLRQSPRYKQMSFEEYLESDYSEPIVLNDTRTGTITYMVSHPNDKMLKLIDTEQLTMKLEAFNKRYKEMIDDPDKSKFYSTFHKPKSSGGLRRIDKPNDELMKALRELKEIFEEDFHALYHTSAYAYVKGRCTVDCVKKHQKNESKWFAKLDLHGFFPSTTLDFVMDMFSQIFPFSEICKSEYGKGELRKALSFGFLNGGLPQGTPLSPTITNIMMIPIDFALSKALRDFDGHQFIYTRYADDFCISSKYNFNIKAVENLVVQTLQSFHAPFELNAKKTKYGNSNGKNWFLGVMLNKDNEITVGYKNKRSFKTMLHNYILDRKNGIHWSIEDLRQLQGLYSYYRMVEPKTIDGIVQSMNEKFEANVIADIRKDLKVAA